MAREVMTIRGLEGVLDTLKQLPPEIVSRRGGPVKSALRKAALVIRKEAQANVRKIVLEPNVDGLPSDSTGLLEKSIIASRNPRPVGANEQYLVRVKRKRYPGQPKVGTQKVGYLLEYGTERRRAMPWIRPAMSKAPQAVQVFTDEIKRGIARVVKKLAAQNRK